jgi:CspA family cold shock protein
MSIEDSATQRKAGTVKWYDAERGFGFIGQDLGGPDVFVHVSAIRDGCGTLARGDKVRFDTTREHKGLQAANIEIDTA